MADWQISSKGGLILTSERVGAALNPLITAIFGAGASDPSPRKYGPGIEKSCFDRDKSCDENINDPYLDSMTDSWHPAIKLLIIVGGAALSWAFVLTAIYQLR